MYNSECLHDCLPHVASTSSRGLWLTVACGFVCSPTVVLLLSLGLTLEGLDVLVELFKVFTLLLELLSKFSQTAELVSRLSKLGGAGSCVRFLLLFPNPHGLLSSLAFVECVTASRSVLSSYGQRVCHTRSEHHQT